ncbi:MULTISPECIES: DUF5694 domain-containing protein [unclassified Carboxylicivirga]|uniref:DUF5694 domain-containing protein n=1 Tax=Carboxylicivirga TaxID=1628153 RepID=UPI003D33D73F
MKKASIITGIMLMASSYMVKGQIETDAPTKKSVIALLGVFHFAGTSDLISIKADDLASVQRQNEIKELVNRLSDYKPTKILVEHPFGDHQTDSLYQLYLKGAHDLSIHECQQIGFRLAKKMGHRHIYPADHKMTLPFKELTDYMKETGQMAQLENMITDMKTIILQASQKAYDESSLSDYFVLLNSDEFDAGNKNMYLYHTNQMGDANNSVGTNLVAKWWERNFRIMYNIDCIEEPGDRILIIFGQGHTAVLKDFYKARTDIIYEEITEYLQ